MAKINFKEFKTFTDITREQTRIEDIRRVLADTIYKGATGIQAHDLAFRIYRSDEEIELDSSDVNILRQLAHVTTPIFMDSLEENLKE